MKKKVIGFGIALILVAIIVFGGIRSVIGWRPFKNVSYDDMQPYSRVAYIDLENMKRESVPTAYFISMLNEISVTTPYDGEYDPWSMDHFVCWEYGDRWEYNRVAFALEPEPIIDIGGKIYRMTKGTAEVYLEFFDNFVR